MRAREGGAVRGEGGLFGDVAGGGGKGLAVGPAPEALQETGCCGLEANVSSRFGGEGLYMGVPCRWRRC